MPQRSISKQTLGLLTVCVAMLLSPSVWVASGTIACQEQDVAVSPPEMPDTDNAEPLASRLPRHRHRMYCAAQRIIAEPTLDRRLP